MDLIANIALRINEIYGHAFERRGVIHVIDAAIQCVGQVIVVVANLLKTSDCCATQRLTCWSVGTS